VFDSCHIHHEHVPPPSCASPRRHLSPVQRGSRDALELCVRPRVSGDFLSPPNG